MRATTTTKMLSAAVALAVMLTGCGQSSTLASVERNVPSKPTANPSATIQPEQDEKSAMAMPIPDLTAEPATTPVPTVTPNPTTMPTATPTAVPSAAIPKPVQAVGQPTTVAIPTPAEKPPAILVTFAPTPTPTEQPCDPQTPSQAPPPAQPTTPPQMPTTARSATPAPEPTLQPASAATSAPTPAPAFDINTWIAYAQNYTVSVGINLNSEAIYCWDNPIVAGNHRIDLAGDIQRRLNRYAQDETILDVWIWRKDAEMAVTPCSSAMTDHTRNNGSAFNSDALPLRI